MRGKGYPNGEGFAGQPDLPMLGLMASSALTDDILADLRLTPLFSGLGRADLAELLAGAEVRTWPAGQVLLNEGQSAEAFYVVLAGLVELIAGTSVIEVLKKGAVLGEAAMFDGGLQPAGARVVGGATVLAVPARPFHDRLALRFDLTLAMLGSMSFRLRLLVRQIAELKLKSTAQRLGGFLLGLVEAESGQGMVRFPYDKRLVADKLGMQPESLSRALARLIPVGVRSRGDNVVAIADIARLRRFCVEDGGE